MVDIRYGRGISTLNFSTDDSHDAHGKLSGPRKNKITKIADKRKNFRFQESTFCRDVKHTSRMWIVEVIEFFVCFLGFFSFFFLFFLFLVNRMT